MGRYQEGENGVGLSPHIEHLRPLHRSMARAVALGNHNPTQLAQTYGYTPGQISRIMGSPLFQAEVGRLEREVEIVSLDYARDLQMMAQKAIENLDEDLNLDPVTLDHRKLRNNASLEVLGMVGVRKTGGNNVNILQLTNINTKQVNEMPEDEIRNEIMDLIENNGTYE